MASRGLRHSSGQETARGWCNDERYLSRSSRCHLPKITFRTGKLLTTPSRLLKLILPLSTLDHNSDRKDIEPLALLVHPQQPLSYLERLIQSELPLLKTSSGDEKIPKVHFRAEDSQQEAVEPKAPGEKKDDTAEDMYDEVEQGEGLEEVSFSGEKQKTGKIHQQSSSESAQQESPGMPPPGPVSGSKPTLIPTHDAHTPSSSDPDTHEFIRWSPSTEIGDFIRDAARSKEFAVEIEGEERQILVGVPSFNDRTHYLRQRLRKTAKKIIDMAAIKRECDIAAHKGAQRVAVSGAGLLIGYWYVVYRLTFETDLGWDVMEPVTYLVGLSCLIGGYLWFLYHNREVSYRAAMNLTISKRRAKLYENKGFNLSRWEGLIEEANAYRNEVKAIAREYDVEWDEMEDEKDEGVAREMRKMRRAKGGKKDKEESED